VTPPDAGDFICEGWLWDPAHRELRHYARKGKGWQEEPDATEQLRPARSVTWHRWAQAPMQTATGGAMPNRLCRVVVAFEGGGDLTINENDRDCAAKLARAIAETYGLPVAEEGAPGGRRRGTVPPRDEMGRLVISAGRTEVALDPSAGEIVETRRRFPFGKSRRRVRLTEVRSLALDYEVKGLMERFTLVAELANEERMPVASYEWYEGWADPEEWREFAQELGRQLGVPLRAA